MSEFSFTHPDYSVQELIYSGSKTLVYRAYRLLDQRPVIIKLLQNPYPRFSELVQFRNQYTIAQGLSDAGIVQFYDLEVYQNGYALVMEDFGGISLKQWLLELPSAIPSLEAFFPIALQLAEILQVLYRYRIIHKDIKPSNLLINPQTRQVKLIDFSIASLLPRETQAIDNRNLLEGTLAYISPEQTGRMNRGIDYRTDFYSLGVTFYEMLTGQTPFLTEDPLEMVHCHIARVAPPVHEVNPEVPIGLSAIVAKLMAKNPEDRYQSALGLKSDLERCQRQFQETGQIAAFALGERDISDRFLIPERLYGREAEVETLLAAFDRVAQGKSELVLVTGFSGIGKTAVVHEVHKPIVRQRGYFIQGKFDQFNRNLPFLGFIQAFRDLMGQLLSESDAQLRQWQTEILQAIGDNGQVILEVIPELAQIIGPQPAVPELSGSTAQNRFHLLFQRFIQVFTRVEHPLVIFLDDLQWADAASLQLMQILLGEADLGYLLLIGAYRDQEVSATHPLCQTLETLAQQGINQTKLQLLPLDRSSVNQMVAETLSCSSQMAEPLAELVYQKTQGNPFFITQFLKVLHQEGWITFEAQEHHWQCEITRVREAALTEDVVAFMALQIQKLPPETQEVLKLAACIGNQFDLATLAIVAQRSEREVAQDLWSALQEGLIVPQSEVYKFYWGLEPEVPLTALPPVAYRFLHDRVQQAAYSLIPSDDRAIVHTQIGRLLLAQIPPEQWEARIFELVNQLNYGLDRLETAAEQEELAQLNLMAARKARSATAYQAAYDYSQTGLHLLGEDAWKRCYAQTLALHELAAETAFLLGDYEQMEQWASLVLQSARTLLDTIKVQQTRLMAAKAQDQLLESLQIGLAVLQSLGVEFPAQPTPDDIGQALGHTHQLWADRSPLSLIDLPRMEDPERLAAMEIMTVLIPSAYRAMPALLPLLIAKQVDFSIQSGNCQTSIFSYGDYGVILCGVIGDLESGYAFGQLALAVLEKLQATTCKSRVGYIVNYFISHWKEPLHQLLEPLRRAYQHGLETGDFECVALNAHAYCYYAFCAGQELTGLAEEMAAYHQAIAPLKQMGHLKYLTIAQQTVSNLLGETDIPWELTGTMYQPQVSQLQDNAHCDRNEAFQFYCNQTLLSYLFEQYEQAAHQATQAEQYLDGGIAQFPLTFYAFYDALIQLARYDRVPPEQQSPLLDRAQKQQAKIQQWATLAPQNQQHRWELIEAERLRVLGNRSTAIEHYDRAIHLAQENGFIQEAALANELAAKFYLSWGKERIATVYLQDAYYGYARWGAKAKVKALETQYAVLLPAMQIWGRSRPLPSTLQQSQTSSSSSGSTEWLDLAAVVRASQAISGALLPDQVIVTLMQLVLENAGAEQGALILHKADQLMLVSQCRSGQVCDLRMQPLESEVPLPVSVVNWVFRSGETFVSDDMQVETRFAGDPYVNQHQPLSVLCLPLIKQQQPIGVLYLENSLTRGAFTSDRVRVLNVLCAQAVISFENASLYENLQISNQSLQRSLDILQKTQAQLVQATEKLQYDAFHDALTDLPNRPWFVNLLEHAVQLTQRHSSYLYAVLFIDLDRFKIINDSLGHAIGDELLKHVAQRLQACVRSVDTVARFGGDEFAILLEELSHPDEAIEVAQRIHDQFALPFILEGYEVFTGASIGIALSTLNYQRAANVLRDADTAMYHAKAQGRNYYAVFDPTMQTQVTSRLQLENDLRRAIESQEFYLVYQPIVSLSTGRLRGFEALVRWYHPRRGKISPIEFIPVAEETGLISSLGWWVLQTACQQLGEWIEEFPQVTPLVMNVNLSALQLKQSDLLDRLDRILQTTQIPRDWLKLEITESCILETFTSEAKQLKQLKELGIRLCIDDFGTGYSSLSRLHEFPIDTLKIDRAFVHRLRSNSSETIQMIITLAHSLGMDVVAEGIETEIELETLQKLGCEFGQGYFFAAPITTEMAREWLSQG